MGNADKYIAYAHSSVLNISDKATYGSTKNDTEATVSAYTSLVIGCFSE